MASSSVVAEQASAAADKKFVIKRTFIELVEEDLTSSGLPPLRLRSYSEPALYDCGLSDEEVPSTDLSDSDTDVKSSGPSVQQKSDDSTNSEPNTGDDETASQSGASIFTSWSCEHLPRLPLSDLADDQGSQSVEEVCAREQAPMDLAALLRENARLALENQLLKENARQAAGRDGVQQGETGSASNAAVPVVPQPWTEPAAKADAGLPHAQAQPGAEPSAPPGVWFVPFGGELYGEQPYLNAYPMQMYPSYNDQASYSQASKAKSGQRRREKKPLTKGASGSDHEPPSDGDRRTTVMLRNLPNNYTREMVLEMLDGEGFAGSYDFLYLPIDFKTQACLGYAFVNLVAPSVVPQFWETFNGYKKWAFTSKKVCCVTWSGPHQGRDAHVDRYRNSPIMHSSVPEEYKPIVLHGGERVPFPAPTKAPKVPRTRGLGGHAEA